MSGTSESSAGPSRRRLLLFGAAATATLVAAYAGVRQIGLYPTPEATFIVLSPKEAAIFSALGDYLLPPADDGIPGSGGDDITLHLIDELLAGLPVHKQRLIRALPLVFEHGTGLDRFGARCMTHLPADSCEDYLSAWSEADDALRMQLWMALKTIYGLTYFERPDVLAAVGATPLCGA